jgi:hypothetical protein
MTKREKLLAALIGMLLVTVCAVFIMQRISSLFDRRSGSVTKLEADIDKQKIAVRQGDAARKRMAEYEKRSLPSDHTLARSLYRDWLLAKAVQVGFDVVNVSPLQTKAQGELYYQHAFLVTGRGDLQELTKFLYAFYGTGYLHRVSRLSAKPIPKSKLLDLQVNVEALSLTKGPKSEKLQDVPPVRLEHKDVAKYLESIVGRNMFAPANNPPQLSAPSRQMGNRGETMSFQVKAKDPDEFDSVTYSLGGTPPEGASIDPKSGEFRWRLEKVGEYEVMIVAKDNGLPQKSAAQPVKIAVSEGPRREPPPAKAGFDPAKQSQLTAITEVSGKRQIWVTVRTEGRVLRLFEGEQLSIGSVQGMVSRIDLAAAEIKTNDGRVIVIGLGKNLMADEATSLGRL